jgi:hypothetical protein
MAELMTHKDGKAEDVDPPKKSGPLTELEQTYLFRCLAVVGSGTYELKKAPQLQIAVLRSVLGEAKERGADWRRIYSAIYQLWASKRPLLPSIEEMEDQIGRR